MLPPLSHPGWKQIITGEKQVKTSQLAVNMMLYNSRIQYERDKSPANVERLIHHAREFFAKYETAYADELRLLFS